MPVDLPFACECGAVQGVLSNVSPEAGKRYACYCDDCQAYIFHLGREADFLDEHGANEVFQTTPARLLLTKGMDKVAPLQMTKRKIYRWRATCCKTPIAVTMQTPMLPFISMHTPLFRVTSRDLTFGPVRGRFFTHYARKDAHLKSSSIPGLVADYALRVAGALMRGEEPYCS